MAARPRPSRWLTASCSDPNTRDTTVWRRDQRGLDRQTARLAPSPCCQNRRAPNRKGTGIPFSRSLCLSLLFPNCSLYLCLNFYSCFSPSLFFLSLSVSVILALHKLWWLLHKLQRLGMRMSSCKPTASKHNSVKFYSVLFFYFILFYSILTLRDWSGGWNVW